MHMKYVTGNEREMSVLDRAAQLRARRDEEEAGAQAAPSSRGRHRSPAGRSRGDVSVLDRAAELRARKDEI